MKRSGVLWFVLLFFVISFSFIYAANEQTYPSKVGVLPFTILRNTFDGITTNFDGHTEEEYRNFSNVVLEKTSSGKVVFEENLDLVTMAGSDMIVDFDSDLLIDDNLIHVDEHELPGINKSALISFYDIDYSGANIYHNGAVCSDCTLISHSGTTYTYRTPFFSGMYFLRENVTSPVCGDGTCEGGEDSSNCPADCGSSSGGGGGGGGGSGSSGSGGAVGGSNGTGIIVPKGYSFYVEPILFEASMGKGTYYKKVIRVINNGTKSIDIGVGISGVSQFVFSEVRSFTLSPGQSRDLRFDIYASYAREADVYTGKILFVSKYITKETKVILNVLEREALFDIRTKVDRKYIPPGGRVVANVTIINMGDLRNFDVSLEYKIIDFDKNEYSVKKEDFAIVKQYNGEFFIDLPKDMGIGDYLFYTRVSYKGVNASSYDTFVVERVSTFTWILLIIIILLMMYLAIRLYLENKHKIWLIGKKKKDDKEEKARRRELERRLKLKSLLPKEVPTLPDKEIEGETI